jgi:hypothetical protein
VGARTLAPELRAAMTAIGAELPMQLQANYAGSCPFPAIASAEGQSKVIRLVRATASGN